MAVKTLVCAKVTRSLGAGQRYLVTRKYQSDGRILQQVNPGVPSPTDWKVIGRVDDLDAEITLLRSQGWEIERRSIRRELFG